MALPAVDYRQSQATQWQGEYTQHLHKRLQVSLTYVRTSSKAQVRAHLRSFLTLLDETRRYPEFYDLCLELIDALHPLPLRWGSGDVWQSHLRFALEHEQNEERRAIYHNALAEIYWLRGEFEQAIAQAQIILAAKEVPATETAYAIRLLFNVYRSLDKGEQADRMLEQYGVSFHLSQPARQVPAHQAQAWLILNLCQLEVLREQARIDEALQLDEDMLRLDEQISHPNPLLTAEMVTTRSTLLWMKGTFQRAVSDLLHAIDLYEQAEDAFNAQALQSNLGLVYWSMGEFQRAESCLQAAILFYRKTGARQLITYDLGNLGLVYFACGHLQAALKQTREHIAHAQKIGFLSEQYRGRRNLGTILYYFENYAEALEEVTSNDDYYVQRGIREGYFVDFVWSACCHYQLGQKEIAFTKIHRAIAWAEEHGSHLLACVSHRTLAYFLPYEEKLPHLERCIELSQTLEKKFEKAAVLLTIAQVLPADRRQQTWQAGVDLLNEMGATAWLEGHSIDDPPYLPPLV